jgi:hypothetical protein
MTSVSSDRRHGLNSSAAIKVPVTAATTANIVLTGEQTIDGVACLTGDRVLVKDQTTASENGIYDVDTGTWSRSLDFDGYYDALQGTIVLVNEGTTYAGTCWGVSTSGAITIGTTSIAFSQSLFSSLGTTYFTQSGSDTVQRAELTKVREVALSVADFGATGDGSNQTTYIKNARTAAFIQGRPLRWPKGVYVCDSLPCGSPAWDAGTAYVKHDLVTSGGNRYVCIVANTNHVPPEAAYWTLCATWDTEIWIGEGKNSVIQYSGLTGDLLYAIADVEVFNVYDVRFLAGGHTSGWAINFSGDATYTIREFCIDGNYTIEEFANGIKLGESLNSKIGKLGRIFKTDAGAGSRTGVAVQTGILTATAWDAGTNYSIGDLVTSGGNTYECLAQHINQVPPNATYWVLWTGGAQQIGTTTSVSGYLFGYGIGIKNANCLGLEFDVPSMESCDIAIDAHALTIGAAHVENCTTGLQAAVAVFLTLLPAPTTWGLFNYTVSSAQNGSKLRSNRQWITRAHRLTTNQTMTADAAYHAIIFNAAGHNSDVDYDVATGLYTAVVPGMYRIHAAITIVATAGQTGTFRIVANGAAAGSRQLSTVPTEGTYQVILDDVCYVDVGGTIGIEYLYSAAVDIVLGANLTYMTIELIN